MIQIILINLRNPRKSEKSVQSAKSVVEREIRTLKYILDMKKEYVEPRIEAIEMMTEEVLLLDTSVGGDADSPANDREFWGDWDDEEDL